METPENRPELTVVQRIAIALGTATDHAPPPAPDADEEGRKEVPPGTPA